jgi:hypothetical protein
MKQIPSPRLFICAFALFSIVVSFARAGADTPNWSALRQESPNRPLVPDGPSASVKEANRRIYIGLPTKSPPGSLNTTTARVSGHVIGPVDAVLAKREAGKGE